MPVKIEQVSAGGEVHPNPFLGPINHTVGIVVDVSGLTTAEVDADGMLKPGVLLKMDGTLADGTASEYIYGAVVEATKVADDNSALGSVTLDVEVAVAVIGFLNRDILEDTLGRALTANELAAVAAPECLLQLTPT